MDKNVGGLIFLYHRVATPATDPQLLAVSPKHFAEQLDVLSQMTSPVPVEELIASKGRHERPLAAVTFDDGYADNFLEADPLLRRAGVPATVFVATAGTEGRGEFFWDELDRLLLQPGRLPRLLRLSVGNVEYSAELADAAIYSEAQFRDSRSWNVTMEANPTPRQRVYRELCAILHGARRDQRTEILTALRTWAGVPEEGRGSHRMMTADELRAMDARGVTAVGAHTVTHPLLAAETPAVQSQEVAESKATLEKILGHPVRGFSYPFGGRRDYNAATLAAVHEAGFAWACSNFPGVVHEGVDRFQLPRMLVRDWDGETFRRHLSAWLTGCKAPEPS